MANPERTPEVGLYKCTGVKDCWLSGYYCYKASEKMVVNLYFHMPYAGSKTQIFKTSCVTQRESQSETNDKNEQQNIATFLTVYLHNRMVTTLKGRLMFVQ